MTWLSAIAYGITAGFALIGVLVVIEIIDVWLARRRDIRRRLDAVKDGKP